MDKYNLQRFVDAQENAYEHALQEMRRGIKRSLSMLEKKITSYTQNVISYSCHGKARMDELFL